MTATSLPDPTSPTYDSEVKHRALERAKRMLAAGPFQFTETGRPISPTPELAALINGAGHDAVAGACGPLRRPGQPIGNTSALFDPMNKQAEDMSRRHLAAVVQKQVEALILNEDRKRLEDDADLQEEQRNWVAFNNAFNATARQFSGAPGHEPLVPGNAVDQFVAKVHRLIDERRAAEAVGESCARVDKQLADLGLTYPVVPEASFESARLLMYHDELEIELARLHEKYPDYVEPGSEPEPEAPVKTGLFRK